MDEKVFKYSYHELGKFCEIPNAILLDLNMPRKDGFAVLDYMKQNNLSPKKIYFVHPNNSKNSTVFLCEAIKGGNAGMVIMPPLFTNSLDGDYIQTIQKLYKK